MICIFEPLLFKEFIYNQFAFNPIHIVLVVILVLFLILHLFYYFYYYFNVFKIKRVSIPSNFEATLPISIVIAARDEYKNLINLIPSLLKLNYPTFEIVLINDDSLDKTDEWASQLAQEHKNFKYTYLNADYFKKEGKKIALTLGIKKASFEHLVLMDADCNISNPNFLLHYSHAFQNNTNLVLGLSPFNVNQTWLNKVLCFENFFTALSYTSIAKKTKPYMGVGRNIGYTKTLYNSVNGFSNHYQIPFGDDDLFVQDVSKMAKTSIIIHPDSITTSNAKNTFKEYKKQRLRHLFAGQYYNSKTKFKLLLPTLFQVLFFLTICISMLFSFILIPLIIWLIKFIITWRFLYQAHRKLYQNKLTKFYPFVSLYYYTVQIIIGVSLYFRKKVQW